MCKYIWYELKSGRHTHTRTQSEKMCVCVCVCVCLCLPHFRCVCNNVYRMGHNSILHFAKIFNTRTHLYLKISLVMLLQFNRIVYFEANRIYIFNKITNYRFRYVQYTHFAGKFSYSIDSLAFR